MTKNKFKVGDQVRVIGDLDGETGRIIEDLLGRFSRGGYYLTDILNHYGRTYWYGDELELVTNGMDVVFDWLDANG